MKRTKFLSFLLAALVVMSCFSCLAVTSLAANVVAHGYTEATKDFEDESERVIAWEFFDDGTLCIYHDVAGVEWFSYADRILKVEVKSRSATDLACSVTRIPDSAFNGYPNLASVNLAGAATTLNYIGAYAFQDCDALTSISIAGVSEIGDYAFYDCDALANVSIGGGLSIIGENVFKSCDELVDVIFGDGVYEIGYGMFEDCTKLANINFPDSLRKIGELAFDDCHSLTEIVLPDGLTEVGRYAFHNCTSVTDMYIGHKTKTIDEYALYGCTSLESVKIACATEIISEGLFMDCTSLSKVELEESIKVIDKNAFKNCISLISFDFPITLETISDTAFAGTGLTEATIPAEVTEILKGAFTNCVSLKEIKVDMYNDSYYSVDGVLYDMALSTVVVCPAGKTGDVVIKDGVTTIADDAFIGCTNLTYVEIPASVTSIADNAFNGCVDTVTIKSYCDSYAAEYAAARGIKFEAVHSSDTVIKVTKPATCEEDGKQVVCCAACGAENGTEETIAALGHNYDDGVITTKPTCETDGVVTFTCTRDNCGDFYTQKIPATTHSMDDGKVIAKASCETAGTMRYTCTNEGCYETYEEPIPATGHKYDKGVVTTEATCEADGVMTYTCQNADCSKAYTDVIPAIGHNYDKGVVTTEATCEADGVKTFTCLNCGDTYTDVIDAIGHNYVGVLTKKATCLEDGKMVYTCANCDDSYEVAVKGDHQFYSTEVEKTPTCTEDGEKGNMCAVCNQFIGATTVIPATGHTYANGTCSDCGEKDPDYKPSTPGTQTPPAAAQKPATPKITSAKNADTGIVIRWNKVEGATSYKLYRRVHGGSYVRIAIVGADATAFTDKGVKAGVGVRYTIIAVNEAGNSSFVNGPAIRRVPTPHLTSVKNARAGVIITWNKVANAETYRVYRHAVDGQWIYIGTTTATSFVDKSLKSTDSGKYYKYTVRAVDYSPSAFEAGLLIKYVATPHVASAKNTASGVSVKWSAVDNATGYRVYRRTAGGEWVLIGKTVGTSYVDKAVKNAYGKVYVYTVKAECGRYTSAHESGVAIKRAK